MNERILPHLFMDRGALCKGGDPQDSEACLLTSIPKVDLYQEFALIGHPFHNMKLLETMHEWRTSVSGLETDLK